MPRKTNAEKLSDENRATPLAQASQIANLYLKQVNRKTESQNLSSTTRKILEVIAAEKSPTQMTISRAVNLSAPAISVALKKLERANLIYRKMDRLDLRQSRVFLTDTGRNIDNQVSLAGLEVNNEVLADFTEEEVAQLSSLLGRVLDNLKAKENIKSTRVKKI